MRLPIVFSIDHNFVMPLCVTINSLLLSSKEETEFDFNVIIKSDVSEEDKKKILCQIDCWGQKNSIKFIDSGSYFDRSYETRGITSACYNRMLIPWLLPDYDKVIYSDCDVIFQGDISDVLLIDLDKYLLAGVNSEVWNKGVIKKYIEAIGVNPKEYVNSGFLVINSELQRQSNLKNLYLELGKKKYVYQDQDIINLVCKGKILGLPLRYNVNPSDAKKEDDVRMIHYVGKKPWQGATDCMENWWKVFEKSIVYDKDFHKRFFTNNLSKIKLLSEFPKRLKENIKFRSKLIWTIFNGGI